MKNLNVFKRISDLEITQLHMEVVLKTVRADIDLLKAIICRQTTQIALLQTEATPVPKMKRGPKPKGVKTKEALDKAVENKRAYAKAYYAKKKAERAAKDAA